MQNKANKLKEKAKKLLDEAKKLESQECEKVGKIVLKLYKQDKIADVNLKNELDKIYMGKIDKLNINN